MRVLILGMMGCPFVGPEVYETRVMDADGDGGISVRFGGADCLDADPSIADCDQDGDGAIARNAGGDDCDDLDASVHPGVQEVCSGRDDDCDGLVDDLDDSISGQPTVWLDADNDEVGGEVGLASCETPVGYVLVSGDCDDNDPSISPNILESCDEVDHNCDGFPREGATNPIDWFEDADGDTFGGALSGTSCEPPDPSNVSNDADCDDADPSATTPRVWYFDGDGDGRGVATQTVQACVAPAEHSLVGDDCDDNNPNRFPGALEACDGVDNDCDGLVDDDDTDVFSPPTWYADADGDGVPNVLVPAVQCIPPSGFIPFVGLEDCNDGDAAIHPNQVEQCDETGTDDDCDGLVNENDPDYRGIAYFLDGDADGFGAGPAVIACMAPAGYSDRDGDCNDANPLVHPVTMWFADLDGDGFGDAADSTVACNPPGLWALDPLDCDDSDALVGDPVAHGVDGDGDGFPGGGTAVTFWCLGDAPGGEAPLEGVQLDCLDTNAGVNPGAQEVYYDGVDINCDPADEFDADGDGVECNWLVDLRCPTEPGVGDCNDSDPLVGPGVPEVVFYDGVDQDCDGDDWDQDGDGWLATPPATWSVPYFDADADDDGLVDAVEQLGYGTDPLLSDTDGDGVPDGMELAGGTDPLVPEIHNLMGDPDGDGLNAAEELIAGTSPIDRDSDDDGVLDGDEVDVHLTDPLVADSDCNDLDPRSFPQRFDFDGASAARSDLGPLGCAVGEVQTLQELIDCNCDSEIIVPPIQFEGSVALAGQRITLRGATPSPVDDALMLEQAPNRCAAGAYLCATSDSTASDDLTQPIVLVDSGPDPVFPGETRHAALVLDRVVVHGGVSGRGSAVRVLDGNVLLLRDAVLSSNLAYTTGGAVYAGPGSLVLVDHSLITENVSVSRGAGIYIDGGAVGVSDSLFYANQGTRSGGLEVVDGSLALTDSEFFLNSAPQIEVSLSVGIATLNGVAVRGPDAVLNTGMWEMPTGVPQLRIGEGAGVVRMVDLVVVGGDPYLEAEGPFEVTGSVFAGSGAGGADPVVRVTETFGSIQRSIFSSVSNGPVAYERATGELMNTIFLDGGSGAGPFVTSDGTVFGPAIASNGFPDVAMQPYSGVPFYPGALNNPAVSCQTIGSCISSDLAVFGDPMLFRFHPALAPDLWDLHLLPGSPLLMPGPNDIGIYASNTAYHTDQDGDGWPDLWEAAVGLVGIAADGPNDDPDSDGLSNSEELAQGGIALSDDTDGDGTLDGSESSGCLLDPRCQ